MEYKSYDVRTTCRSCHAESLVPILSLGDQYVSDFVAEGAPTGVQVPLELVLCDAGSGECGLLQLRHTTSRELLYRHYWYKSGINQTMRDALADIARSAEDLVKLEAGDLVLDIGCNDGTLLRSYKNSGLFLAGFEPAVNLIPEAEEGTTRIINDFFNFDEYHRVFADTKAKVITSIAMFYDLEEPNQFVSDVARILNDDGVWIIQMNYLRLMLEQNAFDNIGHEHLEYYSLMSLHNLLRRHQLEIFDVELNEINGGSFRTYVQHPGVRPVRLNVSDLETGESLLRSIKPYHAFAERVEDIKSRLCQFIYREIDRGKKVYVYGASTRGNTLLQYFGLDHKMITAAAERNPQKYGLRTVGTGIPIISEEQARKERPDYFLVLPWAFLHEFMEREREFLTLGGKFIAPLPEYQIISSPR